MNKLPHWSITNRYPAFYDTESATAIEQTAKIYGAMNSLIDEYNSFIDDLNKHQEEFKTETNETICKFVECVTSKLKAYFESIDMKTDELEMYMKTNLEKTANNYLAEILKDLERTIEQFKVDREMLMKSFNEQNNAIVQQNNVLSGAINKMNSQFEEQNAKINDAIEYMKANLQESINNAVNEMIMNGEIVFGLTAKGEELIINARNITYDTDLSLSYNKETETIHIIEVKGE